MHLTDRHRVVALFALNAVLNAGMLSRLPEIQRDLGLDGRAYGWVLAALSLGVLLAMQAAPVAAARFGLRGLLIGSFVISSLAPPVFGAVPGFFTLFLAMTGFGFVTSLAVVAMNVDADRVARLSGRPLMSRSHGTWSLVFMLTSGLAALAIRLGVPPITQFIAVSLIVLTGIAICLVPMQNDDASDRPMPTRRFVLPDRTTWLLMGFGLISVVIEVVVRNWSIIVLRDSFGAADWIAALSLPAFIAMQTFGRFASDSISDRIGVVAMGRWMAVLTGAGILVLCITMSAVVGIFACALIGLGVSASYPVVISAVARTTRRPPAESVAAFMFLQNVIAFAAPIAFGALADSTTMRLALAMLLPIPVIAWVFARELGRPR